MIQSQSVAGFFKGHPDAKRLHDLIAAAVAKLGDTQVRVTKSQVAFRRLRAFAWTWMPSQYLSGERPPLVLSVSLPAHDPSKRWKQVVEPSPGHFMHHLELRSEDQVDEQVGAWLRKAWKSAGPRHGEDGMSPE